MALRTQQVLAHETGVAYTADPLGGSFYVEQLTNKMELAAEEYFNKIDKLGGVIPAIEKNFFQQEIARAAYVYQLEIERKERIIVGVNDFVESDEKVEIPILLIPEEVERSQIKRLQKLRKKRNNSRVKETLVALKQGAQGSQNLMPLLIDCARTYCTLGEMVNTLKEVFGEYQEPKFF
jgi:methylmalonyl-CoA mutase N-terminal domain/subunit